LPYDPTSAAVIDSRFKPGQEQVEMTLGLNTSCSNFDQSKAEQIALNVDGSHDNLKPDDEVTFPRGQMDRQKLISTKTIVVSFF
jgi:hypothetical protein